MNKKIIIISGILFVSACGQLQPNQYETNKIKELNEMYNPQYSFGCEFDCLDLKMTIQETVNDSILKLIYNSAIANKDNARWIYVAVYNEDNKFLFDYKVDSKSQRIEFSGGKHYERY